MADEGLRGFWGRLGPLLKAGLATLAVVAVAAGIWAAFALLKVDYRVMFSDLSASDAAVIVEQLKASNTRYRLANDGGTILVPADELLDTRMALMSSDTPLTGGVGFEIFDNQGLGATEQSQRVSYQRALQGELARTIASLDNVKQARVHLVLPDSSLFKRDVQEPRAAITLLLKTGAALTREQIAGIQRLVAASVSGLDAAKVVIVDQRGVTLSGVGDLDTGAGYTEARLATKRDVETYLTHKIVAVLDETYGPGKAIVSVDVALNFDEVRRTVQDLLPVRAQTGDGKVLPRLQVNSGATYDDPTWAIERRDGADGARAGNTSSRVEYEYGRRVEQVIAAPGGVTRVSIGVIIPAVLDAESQARIRELVKVVAGVDEARGDEVVVRTLADLGGHGELAAAAPTAADAGPTSSDQVGAAPAAAAPTPGREEAQGTPAATERTTGGEAAAAGPRVPLRAALWLVGVAAVLLVATAVLVARRTRPAKDLSAAERQRLLAEIRRALGDDDASGAKGAA